MRAGRERPSTRWDLDVVLAGAALALVVALYSAPPAAAFEFFDGRVEVHGYLATQVRALSRDFDWSDDVDLAQWYNILNIEIEADLAPDGIGPLEIVEAFVRVEARYDCVWTHACGMFPSVNVYGNDAEHLPNRLIDGRLAGQTGSLRNRDHRRYAVLRRTNFELWNRSDDGSSREPLRMWSLPGFYSLFGNGRGVNQQFDPYSRAANFGDDPPIYHLYRLLEDCRFGVLHQKGGENGNVTQYLGPWNPGCKIRENGALRGNPNPFSRLDFNPILAGVDRTPGTADDPPNPNGFAPTATIVPVGRGALPYRPAPLFARGDQASISDARGIYYPSHALRKTLRSGDLDSIQQNFSQTELAFNRGASQQDEKELKEAYIDIEAAEGRLWMRLGKQTIVWGKTELFRNTDQFNPQDLALASLPGLEESRIALWAARGTWSFYNIGKLEDVRLELALNYDDFEPADLGRCGEPFAVELVCGITFGYFAHGLTGAGLAGTDRPPNPWRDVEGIEVGARVEFRYKRFSFQISDFYGYDDFPYPDRITTYERNVDPTTGRPRRFGSHGPCTTGDSTQESACLGRPGAVAVDGNGQPLRFRDWDRNGEPDDVNGDGIGDILERDAAPPTSPLNFYYKSGELIVDPEFQQEVLRNHPANQTTFALANILCGQAGLDVDPALCGFVSFNGKEGPAPTISTVATGASGLLAGSPAAFLSAVNNNFLPPVPTLNLVRLHQQAGDPDGPFSDGGGGTFAQLNQALGQYLTPEQEALLGCGPYWLSDCDNDGIDILNAEGSVLIQSFPGFDGTRGSVDDWRVDQGLQPGTVPFAEQIGSGPVATRRYQGKLVRLPGSRGFLDELGRPDPQYDPAADGCTQPVAALCAGANVVHPLTGDPFRTELSAVSWNLLMVLASRSDPRDPDYPAFSEFDAGDPNGYGLITTGPNAGQVRKGLRPSEVDGVTPVACGILKPQLCENVRGLLGGIGAGSDTVRAGGNGRYGRRDLAWHSSGELVLRYEKRNVLGLAFDFAEDRTKTNWGVEATWVEGQTFLDNDDRDGVARADTFNLTISADRPTFINFLNPNRTFLFNTQWFVQYISGYQNGFTTKGPVNVLATFTIFTGYHQDRLLIFTTGVYDFASRSGGVLPQVIYRFTENLSATVGANFFFGRVDLVDSPVNELRAGFNRTGSHAYEDPVENGVSPLRDRDEVYLTIRYTF